MQEYGLTIHLGNSGTYESARILNKVISIPEADIPFVRVLFFFSLNVTSVTKTTCFHRNVVWLWTVCDQLFLYKAIKPTLMGRNSDFCLCFESPVVPQRLTVTCATPALCFAAPRQIVYSHTFWQRKSMSLDYTAASVTQGRLTDQYEPANGNVWVNSSACCCCSLLLKAIWLIPPSDHKYILLFPLHPWMLCNVHWQWTDEIFIQLRWECRVGLLNVMRAGAQTRCCVTVYFLLHPVHVLSD